MAYVQETMVHDMRPRRSPQADRPVGQYALLKGPHIASGDSCPVCRAAIDRHWVKAMGAGPYYPEPK